MLTFITAIPVITGLILSLTMAPAVAQATAEVPGDSTTFTLPIVDYAAGINQPCSPGTKTLFKLTAEVAPHIDATFESGEKGFGILVMKSGRSNIETDNPVLVTNEFYWFAGRRAKVDKTSVLDSVTVEVPGPNVEFIVGELMRDCVEQLQGEHE